MTLIINHTPNYRSLWRQYNRSHNAQEGQGREFEVKEGKVVINKNDVPARINHLKEQIFEGESRMKAKGIDPDYADNIKGLVNRQKEELENLSKQTTKENKTIDPLSYLDNLRSPDGPGPFRILLDNGEVTGKTLKEVIERFLETMKIDLDDCPDSRNKRLIEGIVNG